VNGINEHEEEKRYLEEIFKNPFKRGSFFSLLTAHLA